jgi:hypothetical protein
MNRKPKTPTIAYGPEWAPDGTRERFRCIEHASRGLRIVGPADEIIRLGHTGWYTDPFDTGETVRGYVVQLPARGGECVYIPAIEDPCNTDCYICDFHSATDDKKDAARWADSMAESYAERERDYQTKESAKMRAEELREEARTLRAEHSAMIAELRSVAEWRNVSAPAICARIRSDLAAMRARVREALKEAARLDDEPWTVLN